MSAFLKRFGNAVSAEQRKRRNNRTKSYCRADGGTHIGVPRNWPCCIGGPGWVRSHRALWPGVEGAASGSRPDTPAGLKSAKFADLASSCQRMKFKAVPSVQRPVWRVPFRRGSEDGRGAFARSLPSASPRGRAPASWRAQSRQKSYGGSVGPIFLQRAGRAAWREPFEDAALPI